MGELQLLEIETWNDWDKIDLSTLKLRQEQLEILLCQKVKNGEDVSQCLQLLKYLNNQSICDSDVIDDKPLFLEKLERVAYIGAVIALGLWASSILCAAVFFAFDHSTNTQTNRLTDSISKSFKRIKENLDYPLLDENRE